VAFTRELAQLSARSVSGEFRPWPLVETRQANGVCNEVLAPAPAQARGEQQQAVQIAERIAVGIGVTGVLAVELFQLADGQLLINELAMRPHNSGHFSIDASRTSQFEQHLRAALDLPLGETALTAPAVVMANLFGVDDSNDFFAHYPEVMAAQPSLKVHNYGKAPRPGRKMGHVTAVAADIDTALAEARLGAATLMQRG
jgi:5-(carboxyamino)imidazole ribonucleotide synthase